MQLFVKTHTGQTLVFEVGIWDRVLEVKELVHERLGVHPSAQTLVYCTRVSWGPMASKRRTCSIFCSGDPPKITRTEAGIAFGGATVQPCPLTRQH